MSVSMTLLIECFSTFATIIFDHLPTIVRICLDQWQFSEQTEQICRMWNRLTGFGTETEFGLNVIGTVICGSASLPLEVQIGTEMDTCLFCFHDGEHVSLHPGHKGLRCNDGQG